MNATQLEIFYNTTSLTGRDLVQHEMRAGTQNALILQCFRDRPLALLTPFEVRQICHLHTTPITSVRRAMTTLTKPPFEYLEKTRTRRMGEYGELNFTWRLKI
jgi:hypothetical protein